jgi:hypothetical protein
MKMPDITLAQIVAVIGAAFGMLAAFGLPVSQEKQEAIVTLVTVLAPVLIASDAAIRNGRSRIAAARATQEPLYDPVVDEG